MGGVDNNDQLRGYYHVRLKCRNFYKYIFWFLLEVAIITCHLGIQDLKTFSTERKCTGRPSQSTPPPNVSAAPIYPCEVQTNSVGVITAVTTGIRDTELQ